MFLNYLEVSKYKDFDFTYSKSKYYIELNVL